jgi:hypothetical protein
MFHPAQPVRTGERENGSKRSFQLVSGLRA